MKQLIETGKSEIRISKFETNPNYSNYDDQNKTRLILKQMGMVLSRKHEKGKCDPILMF